MAETATRLPVPDEQEMREWAQNIMVEQNLSQTALAKLLNMSSSSGLNQFLKGTYPSPETYVGRLKELRRVMESSMRLHQSHDYRPTSISEDIYTTIRITHLKGGLAVECGDPGIGKTKAGRKYAADYPHTATIVTINPSFATKRNVLKLLCRVCRLPLGPTDEMWYTCVEHFRGSRKVLIIDEAQHLPSKVVDHIRSLADEVDTLPTHNGGYGTMHLLGDHYRSTVRLRRRNKSGSREKYRRKIYKHQRDVPFS